MVKTRSGSDRGKLPVEEGGVTARVSAKPAAAGHAAGTASTDVEKCVNCQYYDRRRARPTDGKAPMWGQCRRHSPHLNPVTAKAYVVEGVWPLVRDDDWCGEWKVLTRLIEPLMPEAALAAEEQVPEHSRSTPVAAPEMSAPAND